MWENCSDENVRGDVLHGRKGRSAVTTALINPDRKGQQEERKQKMKKVPALKEGRGRKRPVKEVEKQPPN